MNFVKDFDERNDISKSVVVGGSWIYFANGAKRELHPLGALIDPGDHKNEEQRLKTARVYYHTILERAVAAFSNRKFEFLQEGCHAKNNRVSPPDIESVKDELYDLQRKVKIAKRRLKAIDDKLAASPEGIRQALLEQQKAEDSERSERQTREFLDELRQIEI